MVLAGLRVLCAGEDEQKTSSLLQTVESLGGTASYLEEYRNSPPNVLISHSVLTEAYAECFQKDTNVPRLKHSWLEACKAAGCKVDYERHRLKAFSGLVLSISGGSQKDKAAVANLIRQHDGVYAPELSRECTHLVIMKRPGKTHEVSPKERYAREWKSVAIVWESWVADNAGAGCYKCNEREFHVPDPGIDDPTMSWKPSAILAIAEDSGDNRAVSSALATEIEQSTAGKTSSADTVPTNGTRIAAHPETSQTATMSAAQQASREPWERNEDTLFLDGAVIHLACCSPDQQLEMLRIIREGGCIRRSDLRQDVTHLVVGSDVTLTEVQAMTEHAKKYGHCCILTNIDWMRQCLEARKLLPVSSSMTLSPAVLAEKVAQRMKAAQEAEAAAAPAAGRAEKPQEQAGPSRRFLEGYFFTLTAIAGTEDEAFAHSVVRQGGGRFFDHRTLNLVAKERAYAICPVSMTPAQVSDLIQLHPDIHLVPGRNWVTLRWLDASQDQGAPLDPIPVDRVEFQPLPFALPMPAMQKVVVSASALEEEEKNSVKLLVKLLGGQYTIRMGHRNTHLIVRYAAGEKYRGAPDYGVKPVTCRWLIDVAKTGKMLAEDDYHPPPPPAGEYADKSQFPFEASEALTEDSRLRPTQGAADTGSQGKQPSALQCILGKSSQQDAGQTAKQAWQGGRKQVKLPPTSRLSQGPSRLDALNSRLQNSPSLKRKQQRGHTSQESDVPQQPPLAQETKTVAVGEGLPGEHPGRKVEQGNAKVSAQQEERAVLRAIDLGQSFISASEKTSQGTGSPTKTAVLLEAMAERHDGTASAGALMDLGSADDLTEHLERVTGALAQYPAYLSMGTQQDTQLPSCRARKLTKSGASDGCSPSESYPGPKRTSRSSGTDSQDSQAKKKPRGSASLAKANRGPAQQRLECNASQMDFSQQVAYEGDGKAGMAVQPAAKPPKRPSRMSKSSSAAQCGGFAADQ